MRAAKNTYDAMTAYHRTKDLAAFIKANPDAWKTVKQILDMRRDGNK